MVIRAAHKTCFRLTFLTENLQRPFILHQLEEGEVAFRQKVVASERRPSFENPQQRTHASHVVLQTSSCAHARHTRPAWQHEGRVRRSPGIVRDSILFMFRREHCFFMFQREYCSPTSFHLNQTDITWTEMWHMHLISDFFFTVVLPYHW